jgi:cytochrome P450 family 3 subfamily A
MTIQISIHSIHHNPHFYPNPYHFSPDRFLPQNREKLIPYTYLPFGAGPRNCVGMRFALMEAKTIIANAITKYKFVRTENTKVPLQFIKFVGFMQATDVTIGVQLREPIANSS